jgi:hypothetical protein
MMRRKSSFGFASLLVFCTSLGAGAASAGEGIRPEAALERLKSLAGRWEGHLATVDGPTGAVEYRVTSGGKTVMEIMFPGEEHEMVSMYYVDGSELVAKHYCAMGNQPEMKLDESSSSENELHFVFTGGTNLDHATDPHVHGGTIAIKGDRLENVWDVYAMGKKGDPNRFFLARAAK